MPDTPSIPAVVLAAASGNWPEILHGPQNMQMIVYIESFPFAGIEDATSQFPQFWEEALEDETWTHLLDPALIGRLEIVEIGSFDEPEGGCADHEVAADYAKLTTAPPPILIFKGKLQDGHHRLTAARQRGETHMLAYVITAPTDGG